MRYPVRAAASLAVIVLLCSTSVAAREEIRIVGSPLVLGFVQQVAIRFAENFQQPAPSIELTGSGNGFGMFCAGVGFGHPDVNAASRRISQSEIERCQRNGVFDVTEIEFGLDGLVVVSRSGTGPVPLSRELLFLALAREVPGEGALAKNRAESWRDLDPNLPDLPIRVMGPPGTTTATYAFQELVMAAGCGGFPAYSGLDEDRRHRACRSLRRDDAFEPGAKSEAQVVEWLEEQEAGAMAVVSFSTFERNRYRLVAHPIEGVEPDPDTISTGSYPLSRPMYVYVKSRHVGVIPGLQELLYELTSERAVSPDGYLADRGEFIPLDDIGRNRARDRALSLSVVQ